MRKLSLLFFALLACVCTYAHDAHKGLGPNYQLAFLENKGQITDQYNNPRTDIDFALSTKDINIFLGNGQLHYQFTRHVNIQIDDQFQKLLDRTRGTAPQNVDIYRLDVALIGANINAVPMVSSVQPSVNNYYTAGTGERGIIGVRTYQKVTYKDIYPNIDWVLYVADRSLKYDFIVHKGGNVADIKLQYNGCNALDILEDNSMCAITPYGRVMEKAPYTYMAQNKEQVPSWFTLDGNTVGFATGAYAGDIVIDPGVEWATYYGGGKENFHSVSTDNAGNVYVSGTTTSLANVATIGAHQIALAGNKADAFLAKFDSAGTCKWATYYGGSTGTFTLFPGYAGTEITAYNACDKAGHIYIAGSTTSSDNIATPGSYQPNIPLMGWGTYLVQFNTDGIRQWGTYFAGEDITFCSGITCDGANNIYIVGGENTANSVHNLASVGAHQMSPGGGYNDGYIAKFNSNGSRLWSSYYGGADSDNLDGVACDADNNVFGIGLTLSNNQIATSGNSMPGDYDGGFIVKFNSEGTRIWGKYGYAGYSIVCDKYNGIYTCGTTQKPSLTGVATSGAFSYYYGGISDYFLMRYNNDGQRLWGTYYGGEGQESSRPMLSCDSNAHAYLSGTTTTKGVVSYAIATPGSYQDTLADSFAVVGFRKADAFVAEFDTAGNRIWATYYGGLEAETIAGVACSNNGALYLSGSTASPTRIATTNSHQDTLAGNSNIFLAKFVPVDVAISLAIDTLCVSDTSLAVLLTNKGRLPQDAIGVTYAYTNNSNGVSDTFHSITLQPLAAGASMNFIVGNTKLPIANYTVTAFIESVAYDETQSNDTAIKNIVVRNCNTDVMNIATSNYGINIYPNPTDGKVLLVYDGLPQQSMEVSVVNVLGQEVLSRVYATVDNTFKANLDLSTFTAGIYLVHISFGDKTITKKVVVQ